MYTSAFEFLLLPFDFSSVKANRLSDEGGRTKDGLRADSLESKGELDSVAETCAAAQSAVFARRLNPPHFIVNAVARDL